MTTDSRWTARNALVTAACLILASGCSADPAESGDHMADFDGVKVHYQIAGQGETPVVLIHGWICSHEVWKHQMSGLADRARLIAIDLPGHGKSDVSEDVDYTMEHLARGVAAVMDHAEVERAVIMGHSNGVPVMRQFYRMFPDRTLALIAADGNLVLAFTPEQAQQVIQRFEGEEYPMIARNMFGRFLPEDHDPAEREAIIEMVLQTPKHVALATMKGRFDPDLYSPDPIKAPLLVINAENAAWTPEYEAQIRAMAPEVDYRTMTGVKHLLQMDEPEVFNRHVIEFLDANGL